MATHYGFFDSVNSDRKYSAEDFNRYLSGLISDGIFENYGDCFEVTVSDDMLFIAPGKAWLNGHFFESDATERHGLYQHRKANADTTLYVRICCDKETRTCGFVFQEGNLDLANTNTKTYIMLAQILVRSTSSTSSHIVMDKRELNNNENGYVKCVLTKCGIGDFLRKLDDYTSAINRVNQRLTDIESITGTSSVSIISKGKCGDNANYVWSSDGVVRISGSGECYDYTYGTNTSPFAYSSEVRHIIIEGTVSSIGEDMFYGTYNLESITNKSTALHKFGKRAFSLSMGRVGKSIDAVTLPPRLMIFGTQAFGYTGLKSVEIPPNTGTETQYQNGNETFTTMGQFRDCVELESADIKCKIISEAMFLNCSSLNNVSMSACTKIGARAFKNCSALTEITLPRICRNIGANAFTGCNSLTIINYMGAVNSWEQIVTKGSDWCDNTLIKIQCTNGYFSRNSSGAWVKYTDT